MRLIAEAKPDVVLLDVHMPGGGGVEVIRRVAETAPAQSFLALSVSDAAEDVIAVVRAGARGYVTKTISGAGAGRRRHPRPRRRRRFLAPPRRLRPRCFRRSDHRGRGRPRARPAHPARARGPPPHRPRLPLQGDRPRALDLAKDRRGARLGRPQQAPAIEPPRAQPLGGRAPPRRLTPGARHGAWHRVTRRRVGAFPTRRRASAIRPRRSSARGR